MVPVAKIIFRAVTFFCLREGMSVTQTFLKLEKHFQSFNHSLQSIINWRSELSSEVDIFPKKAHSGNKNDDELEHAIREQIQKTPSISAKSIASFLQYNTFPADFKIDQWLDLSDLSRLI